MLKSEPNTTIFSRSFVNMFRSYQDMVRTPKETEKSPRNDVYNCDMCIMGGWPSENDVEIHRKKAHSIALLDYKAAHRDRFCTVCMTLYDSNKALISHIKSHHLLSSPNANRVERIIYICDECSHIFFNRDVLETHMLYVHLTKKSNRKAKHFICPKCSKKCLLQSIWFHFQKHEIPSVSLCDICLTNFPNRGELYKHLETHRGLYTCEPCGYNSNREIHFKAHMQNHALREIPSRKVSLDVLSVVFKKQKCSMARYNVHNTIKGLNLPRFIEICTLCREICLSHREKKNHFLRDHMLDGTEKKKHVCVCGEEFYNKVLLKQHVMKMKGSHKPVEETSVPTNVEVWRGDMLSAHTKVLTIQHKKKLKSVLRFNIVPKAQETTSVVCEDDDDSEKLIMAVITENELQENNT